MLASVESILASYNQSPDCNTKFGRFDDKYYVSICTPLMSRAHKLLRQASELVMVDAADGLGKQRHRLYLFISPTAAGGVPVGAVITNTEQQLVFEAALRDLVECFPVESFFGQGFPSVFLTDNDLKEREPLQHLFPQSRLLLCQFHMLKAVWAWLCDSKHGVSRDDRQEVYMAFKSALYAPTEQELCEKFHTLTELTAFDDSERCAQYFELLWSYKEDWAFAYRTGLPLRGSNTMNYIEVAFRILKDCVFDRVMAFTLPQLVDFIVTRYEAYMEKRLLDFSSGHYSKALLCNMMPSSGNIASADVSVVDAAACTYSVRSSSGDSMYSVDLARGFCTCYQGASGKLCKHASAVLLQLDDKLCTAYNVVNYDTKVLLFRVATGNTPPPDWLLPLDCPAANSASASDQHTNVCASDSQHISTEQPQPFFVSDSITSTVSISDTLSKEQSEALSAVDMARLDVLFGRIKQGLVDSANIFVPACRRMLDNTDKFAATDTGLVSAMHTFGKYSGLQPVKARPVGTFSRRRGVQIGVQLTAVGRRRQTLSGKRKLSAGRPSGLVSARSSRQLAAHDYTTFGSLPARKRKAPHNLQQCVYGNVGLGSTKRAKK